MKQSFVNILRGLKIIILILLPLNLLAEDSNSDSISLPDQEIQIYSSPSVSIKNLVAGDAINFSINLDVFYDVDFNITCSLDSNKLNMLEAGGAHSFEIDIVIADTTPCNLLEISGDVRNDINSNSTYHAAPSINIDYVM